MKKLLPLILSLFMVIGLSAQKKDKSESEEEKPRYEASAYSGLKFRSIGPALTSGRIADIAVNPAKPHEFYLAIASGGVWKTSNNGITFEPIFDGEGSYSFPWLLPMQVLFGWDQAKITINEVWPTATEFTRVPTAVLLGRIWD
jgi:hypothetical protein